jgi:hypothetical protein
MAAGRFWFCGGVSGNPGARIFKGTADDSPSPWGEGKVEGESVYAATWVGGHHSGGALVDTRGNVVGIVAARPASDSGFGFCIWHLFGSWSASLFNSSDICFDVSEVIPLSRQRAALQATFIRVLFPAPVNDGCFIYWCPHRPVEQLVFFEIDK